MPFTGQEHEQPDHRFPPHLPVVATMRQHASGRDWLARLPALVENLREQWQLRLGAPYHGGSCSWVAPALLPDGTAAVFKVTWPHPEARHEATALRLWSGHGAVEVYAHDAQHYALLLERCTPGTELGNAVGIPAEDRLRAACAVLRELWSAANAAPAVAPDAAPDAAPELSAMARLGDVTAEWADLAEERAARHGWPDDLDTGLFTLAAGLLRDLPHDPARPHVPDRPHAPDRLRAPDRPRSSDRPRSPRHETVVHGDFNPGNLLAAHRRPWLAIDPKPMTGDPAFDPWPLIEQVDDPFAYGSPGAVLTRRTALVADELGVDVDRLRAWAVARHVEYVLWSVDEDDDLTGSVRLMRQARVLADVAGL